MYYFALTHNALSYLILTDNILVWFNLVYFIKKELKIRKRNRVALTTLSQGIKENEPMGNSL